MADYLDGSEPFLRGRDTGTVIRLLVDIHNHLVTIEKKLSE